MDNIKDDAYYLNKMLDDLRFLIEHTKGKTYKQVESDPVLIDSIMFRLIQIAENSDRLTPAFKAEHSDLSMSILNIKYVHKIVRNYAVIITIISPLSNLCLPNLSIAYCSLWTSYSSF